jgi:hypothetical protein
MMKKLIIIEENIEEIPRLCRNISVSKDDNNNSNEEL